MGQMFFPGEYRDNTTAKIHKLWIQQNVCENGIIGLRIHVKFEIENGLNVQDQVAIYFYYPDGKQLMDKNNRFCTNSRQVAVSRNYNSIYKNSTWEDFTLFIPKNELHLNTSRSLHFMANIWHGQKVLAQKKSHFYFNY